MSRQVEGLDEIVESPELHCFDGAIHHVAGAHHEHDTGRFRTLDLPQHLHAVDAGQYDVEQG